MPSPFPGMNPYLEQDDVWHDFHQSVIPLMREMLREQVRPNYVVKVEEHLFIHELSSEERRFLGRGDVTRADSGLSATSTASVTLTEAPAYGWLPNVTDVERHSYLEIRDRSSRELVTVIELLSPSNKYSGSDRDQYLAKRWQFLSTNVHLVELDLLRGGPRMPIDDLPGGDYYACIARVEERPRVGIWPIHLRERLPVIPIPLRQPHADAHIDLQDALNRVYDAAGYEDYIYLGTPQPRLNAADAEWAQALLTTAGIQSPR